MGTITKIQSISDIITNSSSEVFVMTEQSAKYYEGLENTNGCVCITPITMDWILSWSGMEEWEMICSICELDRTEIQGEYHKSEWYSYYDGPNEKTWETFVHLHQEAIEEHMKDLYWVDIEDHFPDCQEVNESAKDDALWSDYRH